MFLRGASDVLYERDSAPSFRIDAYVAHVRGMLPSLDESDSWIRSGLRIPKEFKDAISSYRLLGSCVPDGRARIEALLVKTQAGVGIEAASQPAVAFVRRHLFEEPADAAFVALTTTTGEGANLYFIRSPRISEPAMPDDMLKYMCDSAIKHYLSRKCGIPLDAVGGYMSSSRLLFDDSLIRAKAKEIDRALGDLKFCDIASGTGRVVMSMADSVVSLRRRVCRIFSSSDRRENTFLSHFIKNSLYATDCDAGAIEALKAELSVRLGARYDGNGRLPWGSILTDDLFKEERFDIVATNPPHVRLEQFSEARELLRGYASYGTAADLYCYYAERAFSCAEHGGVVSLLMSNRWMRSDYGAKLRAFLSERNVTDIVDYGDIGSVAGTVIPMCVVTAANEPPCGSVRVTAVDDARYGNLCDFSEERSVRFTRAALGSGKWVFEPDGIGTLVKKIEAAGKPLEEFAGASLCRGILTGLNEAFVVDEKTARELGAGGESKDVLRPFYTGRDVRRYAARYVRKRLIFIPKGLTDAKRGETQPWEWFSSAYPKIAAHLGKYSEKAARRRDKGDYWWELRSCSYIDKFEAPKIVCPMIVRRSSAALVEAGILSNDKTVVVPCASFYLLGLLNSSVADFFFRRKSPSKLLNGYYELRPPVLASFPVPSADACGSARELYRTVEECARLLFEISSQPEGVLRESRPRADSLQKELNAAVSGLYGLSVREVSLVDNY